MGNNKLTKEEIEILVLLVKERLLFLSAAQATPEASLAYNKVYRIYHKLNEKL